MFAGLLILAVTAFALRARRGGARQVRHARHVRGRAYGEAELGVYVRSGLEDLEQYLTGRDSSA